MRPSLSKILAILGIYKIYEKWLGNQIKDGVKPNHIGIILDGNRRWAIRHGYKKWYGHRVGAKKLREVIGWINELGIKCVTVFVFSTENFNRPEEEVDKLMEILKDELNKALNDEKLLNNGVKIKFIGDLSRFPDDIQKLAKDLEEKTRNNSSLIVNVALGYGGKWDIVNATKKIIHQVIRGALSIDKITPEVFQKYLSTSHLPSQDVDLILRTGGEMRLSNFLLWQAAYSELVFLDIYWPEFRKIDLMRAIRIYQKRVRRFGK